MFLADMKLLADNARKYHSAPEDWVVQHADLLYQVAEEKVDEFSEEISQAEEMITKTEQEGMSEVAPSETGTPFVQELPSSVPPPPNSIDEITPVT